MSRRLIAVAPVDHPGGAETCLLRLLGGLKRRGWQVAVTTPGAGPLRDAALAAGFEWHALPVGGLLPRTGARAARSWPRARALRRQADVVYLNGAVCGRLLPAFVRGPRTVLHIHDMVERVPPFWRLADVVLAASGAVAERLPGLSAHVVYGPVDPDPPVAKAPWPAGDGPVVGFIGRFEPRKGPLDLAQAAPAIHAGSPRARIVMVGDDPYGADPAYVSAVRAAPGVERHGWVDNAPGVMRHLDVLVLPSRVEPFGTVLAEAMAVGTPVVASRVDGLPEVVEDGVSGRLVPPGRPDLLAEAVLEVLARRGEMGAAARERARRFFVEDHVALVESLIEP